MMRKAIRPPGRKRRNGLAAFRSVELEVHAALAAGQTVLSIYEEKRDRLAMSYAQFARYVQRLRKEQLDAAPLPARFQPGAPNRLRAVAERRTPPAVGTGPPRGRPEDAVPNLDMDGFATQALNKKDLF
jgi:beta-phosphoglucomutase-like phosphatase (HAD superfamily)